jgi:hypothetical protein
MKKHYGVIDNLGKEFVVYKSDMLELVNAHTDKLMDKFSAEIRHVENRLEGRIDRLDSKIDRLFYGIIFAILVPISLQLVLFFLKK